MIQVVRPLQNYFKNGLFGVNKTWVFILVLSEKQTAEERKISKNLFSFLS